MNLIFSELGWIEKGSSGWTVTKLGKAVGGRQFEDEIKGNVYVKWPQGILQNKSLIEVFSEAPIASTPSISVRSSRNFRDNYPASFRTLDGHRVRSKAEMIIDNILYQYGLVHAYERKLPIDENVVSDFYIPAGKVYIEYWGLENDRRILKGNVSEKISEVADSVSAKFIIMGLNSSPIGMKKATGQNTLKVIREAKCPVITVKENMEQDECKNIVLPLDLTKESREKVGPAIEYAKYYKAPIRIISVFSGNELQLENRLLAYTHQAKKFIKENGVACSNKTVEGDDRAQIVIDYTNKIKADLIIITTQFASTLKEFLKGTVSQQIVKLSNVPVMSLPPIQRKDTTSYSLPF